MVCEILLLSPKTKPYTIMPVVNILLSNGCNTTKLRLFVKETIAAEPILAVKKDWVQVNIIGHSPEGRLFFPSLDAMYVDIILWKKPERITPEAIKKFNVVCEKIARWMRKNITPYAGCGKQTILVKMTFVDPEETPLFLLEREPKSA